MKSFALSDARRDLPTRVDKSSKEPILITRHGEDAAVMISPSLYEEMIEAMEELEDIAAYDAAKARKEDSVLWQDARKDLGLAWALLQFALKKHHVSFLKPCKSQIRNESMPRWLY